MSRWVRCIPASVPQFSDLFWFISPHRSQSSDVPERPPQQIPLLVWQTACGSCQIWAFLWACGQEHLQNGIQLSCVHCISPNQMCRAQDKDFSRAETISSQRLWEMQPAEKCGKQDWTPNISQFSQTWDFFCWVESLILYSYSKSNFTVYLSKIIKTT